jgi:hypothetical protein
MEQTMNVKLTYIDTMRNQGEACTIRVGAALAVSVEDKVVGFDSVSAREKRFSWVRYSVGPFLVS